MKKLLSVLLTISIIISVVPIGLLNFTVNAATITCEKKKTIYWDGTFDENVNDNGEMGAENDPIIIDSAEELYWVCNMYRILDNGKWYKIADNIGTIVLQPEDVVDLNVLKACENADDVKNYLTSLDGVTNWNGDNFFNGNFVGNGVEIYGLYCENLEKSGCAGLFKRVDAWFDPTDDFGFTDERKDIYYDINLDEPTIITDITIKNSYFKASQVGTIFGSGSNDRFISCSTGVISIENCIINNCYLEGNSGGVLFGWSGDQVRVDNCLVYDNKAVGENGVELALTGYYYESSFSKEAPIGYENGFIKFPEDVVYVGNQITNSILLNTIPYRYRNIDVYENVYTDAPTVEVGFGSAYDKVTYKESEIKNISGLFGFELALACDRLDWSNIWLATENYPIFRSLHDAELVIVDNGDGTHTETCSCGFNTGKVSHLYSNEGVCIICNNICIHDGDNNPVFVKGTATCTETGIKDYYQCSRCNIKFEDKDAIKQIEDINNWIANDGLGHIVKTDNNGVVYSSNYDMHYKICSRDGCNVEFDGEAHTSAEYVPRGECGHIGVCKICSFNIESQKSHAFDNDYNCTACGWIGTKQKLDELPKDVVVIRRTATSVTLAPYTGYEYSMDGIMWKRDNHFDGLKANTEYTFYQRFAETEDYYASKTSAPLKVTTLPKSQCSIAPAKPIVANYTVSKVVLVEREGYEYSIDGVNWTNNTTFDGLKDNTKYTFYQRIAETETELASAKSVGVSVTTDKLNATSASSLNLILLKEYIKLNGDLGSDGQYSISITSSTSNQTTSLVVKDDKLYVTFSHSMGNTQVGKSWTMEFQITDESKYLVIDYWCSYWAKVVYSKNDDVEETVVIDRSTHTKESTYTLEGEGKMLVSNTAFSKDFNDILSVTLSAWDSYIYNKLGFGLRALGFISYDGYGKTVCDWATGYHIGGDEIRNKRDPLCTIDGYTGYVYCTDCHQIKAVGTVIESVGQHTYTNNCDAYCNVCNEGRIITHTYSNDCDISCNTCGDMREETTHTFDTLCDDNCNECSSTRNAPHLYTNTCDTACDLCEKTRVAPHNYDDYFDTTCNNCDNTRVVKIWQVTPSNTGVYNIKPSENLQDFNKDSIIVFDSSGKEVKYYTAKQGWPLVAGQVYTVILNIDYTDTNNLSWNLTKKADTIFPDTQSGAWYNDSVTYVVGAGIMSGYSNGKFGTSDSIQRQDFLVMLARYEGVDLSKYNYKSKFSDVARGSYYEAAVNWGAEMGIVTGYDNGKFGVGDKVTREQLVTFLYRYAKYKGIDTTCTMAEKNYVKNTYSDYKNVSLFAQDAIVWAVTYGVIGGKTPTTIVPQGNAQRCEVAKIMYNIYLNDIFK